MQLSDVHFSILWVLPLSMQLQIASHPRASNSSVVEKDKRKTIKEFLLPPLVGSYKSNHCSAFKSGLI